jgi:hypothetical protein
MVIDHEYYTFFASNPKKIATLLDQLPPERLPVVETFIRFVQTQLVELSSVGRYPTVLVSANSLDNWMDLLAEGYESDALADTESLYDEV